MRALESSRIYFNRPPTSARPTRRSPPYPATQLKLMPRDYGAPGPDYSASTVPIIQLALSGKGMSEQTLSIWAPT